MKTPTEMIKYLNENYGIQDLDKIIKGITKAKVKIIKIKEPNYLEMLDMVSDKKNKIRPVINNICCNKNISIATDLENTIIVPKNVAEQDGIYSTEQIKNKACSVSLYDIDDFPRFHKIKGKEFTISKSGISSVIGFADKSLDNLSIAGVRVSVKNNKIYFVATDSYKIKRAIYETDNADFEITIPLKTSKIISKIFTDEPVKLTINDNKLQFEQNDIMLLARSIDLPFINHIDFYSNLNTPNYFAVDTQELIEKLKMLEPVAKLNSSAKNCVNVILKDNVLKLKSMNDTMKKEFELNCVSNADIKINLNLKFWLESIDENKDEVVVKFNRFDNAVVIDECVMMPLRLED